MLKKSPAVSPSATSLATTDTPSDSADPMSSDTEDAGENRSASWPVFAMHICYLCLLKFWNRSLSYWNQAFKKIPRFGLGLGSICWGNLKQQQLWYQI